jgi:hypothetical protein
MQNLTSTLSRFAVIVAGALALGSCSRSNYAFLPKADSYLGTTKAASKVRPVATPTAATAVEVAAAPVATSAQPAPVASPAIAPEVTVATPAVAPQAVAAVPAPAPVAAPVAAAPAAELASAPAAAPKLNLLQRLAVSKVMRKLDKQTQKLSARKGDNTASTARGGIDGKLRYAIIFGAISLIFFVLGGSVGNLIGTILLIIALLFLLFWLLDNL